MRKFFIGVSLRKIWYICFILAVVSFCAGRIAGADVPQSFEGVWELVSVSSDTERSLIGKRISIIRQGEQFAIDSVPPGSTSAIYQGNERRIVRTELELLLDSQDVSEGSKKPAGVIRKFEGQRVPINYSFTLSADGNFLTREQDSKSFHWQENRSTGEVRNIRYEITPGYYKRTFKRISGPIKVENRSDRAYQADCGPVAPNKAAPIITDLCPGNLVAMTYFCGGGTGCPYVCCPKGLPFLNHCDCKCYATAEFECHSYSRCQEQPRQ